MGDWFLLFDPAAEVDANLVEALADVLVAWGVDLLKLVEQTGLVPQDVEAGVEVAEELVFFFGKSGSEQAFEQVVEAGDDAVAEGKFVVSGEFVEDGHVPGDQIVGFLDDGQFGHGFSIPGKGPEQLLSCPGSDWTWGLKGFASRVDEAEPGYQRRPSCPGSAWVCRLGGSASGVDEAEPREGVPRRSLGTRMDEKKSIRQRRQRQQRARGQKSRGLGKNPGSGATHSKTEAEVAVPARVVEANSRAAIPRVVVPGTAAQQASCGFFVT
jgi:hypothetical protein